MISRSFLAVLLGSGVLLILSAPSTGHSQTASPDGTWFQYTFLARGTRGTEAVCYDPVRQRLIVVGGWGFNSVYDDVRALDLVGPPDWQRLDNADAPLPRLTLHRPIAIFDKETDRVVVITSLDGVPVVGALDPTAPSRWTPIDVVGSPPSPRQYVATAIDPLRNRLLLFGGAHSNGGQTDFYNDVWALNLGPAPSWEQIAAPGPAPIPRESALMAYDSARDRLVMFGGAGPNPTSISLLTDTWVLSLSPSVQWTRLDPAGSISEVTLESAAIYDPVHDRVLLLRSTHRGGNRALRLAPSPEWVSLPSLPGAASDLESFAAALDPPRGRALVFGGFYSSDVTADTWQLDLSTDVWTRIFTGTVVPNKLGPYRDLLLDPVRDQAVMYLNGPVWRLSFSTGEWTRSILSPNPGSVYVAFGWYDPYRDQARYYGQFGNRMTFGLWVLNLGSPAWTSLPLPPSGLRKVNGTFAYDPVRDRLIGFFGDEGVWVFPLADASGWTRLTTSGTPPPAAGAYGGVYDGAHDAYVVTGEATLSPGGDIVGGWALSLGDIPTWSEVTPPAHGDPSTGVYPAFDPVRSRALSFGGWSGTTSVTSATHALALPSAEGWVRLAPAGAFPAGRTAHAVAYDALRDQLLIWAGYQYGSLFADDVWGLVFGPGHPPGAGCGDEAVWVAGDATPLSFEIENPYAFPQDVVYTLTSSRAWAGYPITGEIPVDPASVATVSVPAPAPDTAAAGVNPLTFTAVFRQTAFRAACERAFVSYNTPTIPSLARMQVESGRVFLEWRGAGPEGNASVERRTGEDDWVEVGESRDAGDGTFSFEDRDVRPGGTYAYRLRWSFSGVARYSEVTTVRVPMEPRAALRLASPSPGHELRIAFTLADHGPARLSVYDLGGRRVFGRDVGALGPGTHEETIGSRVLAPGLYFVRLDAGGRSMTARAVIVR